MTERRIEEYWDENAEKWSFLAKAGYDLYRDHLNNPAFLSRLPLVTDLVGIDIGCGDGSNTRILENLGALMTGIDISGNFISIAKREHAGSKTTYLHCSALKMPFSNNSFNFATGFMSFMDMTDIDRLFKEISRILKPDGFVQFSISHPCYNPSTRKNLRNASGQVYAVELGPYPQKPELLIDEWLFGPLPSELRDSIKPFKIPRYTRSLSKWFDAILGANLKIEMLNEPFPTEDSIKNCPKLIDATIVPYFLHIRCRKDTN
jgi:ubiquinone/menaquinone biosynthesis C-methylase UbiE